MNERKLKRKALHFCVIKSGYLFFVGVAYMLRPSIHVVLRARESNSKMHL